MKAYTPGKWKVAYGDKKERKSGMKKKALTVSTTTLEDKAFTREYDCILRGMVDLLENARRAAARSVNAVMTATYWEVGHRIAEIEQRGKKRR